MTDDSSTPFWDREEDAQNPRYRTPRARYHRLVEEGEYEMWWIESDDGWFHLIDYEDSHEPSIMYTPADDTTANSDYMGPYKEIHESAVPKHIVGLVRGYQQRTKEYQDQNEPSPFTPREYTPDIPDESTDLDESEE